MSSLVSTTAKQNDIIKYLVASEFDINLGPVITAQYPCPIPGPLPFFAELLLPDQIHTRHEDWTVIILHQNSSGQYQYGDCEENTNGNPLYILNVVNTKFNQKVYRNTIIKGIGIATTSQSFHMFKPLLLFALDQLFQIEKNDFTAITTLLQSLFDAINLLDIPQSMPAISFEKKLLMNSTIEFPIKDLCSNKSVVSSLSSNVKQSFLDHATLKNNATIELIVNYASYRIPLRIPLIQLPDIVGDFSIKDFLSKFLSASLVLPNPNQAFPELTIYGASTPSIIVLINAFLTHKRIFFLGTKKSAHEICECVFATIALISGGGLLNGLLKKTFPYIDLSKFDFIESQTWYFAGTANPTFKFHDQLWDVLYDMESNELVLSAEAKSIADVPVDLSLPNEFHKLIESDSYHSFDEDAELDDKFSETSSDEVYQNNYTNAIITEDAAFLKKLNILIRQKHDDDTTLVVFRQHINRIMLLLESEKQFVHHHPFPPRNFYTHHQQPLSPTSPTLPISSLSRSGSFVRRSFNNRTSTSSKVSHTSTNHTKNNSMNSFSTNTSYSMNSKHSSVTTNDSIMYNYQNHPIGNGTPTKFSKSINGGKHKRSDLSINTSYNISAAYNGPLKNPTNNLIVQQTPQRNLASGYFWNSKAEEVAELRAYYFVYKAYSQGYAQSGTSSLTSSSASMETTTEKRLPSNPIQYYFDTCRNNSFDWVDILYQLALLQNSSDNLSVAKTTEIFQAISDFTSSLGTPQHTATQRVEQFLICTYLLPSQFDNEFFMGKNLGLELISLGLYHKEPKVRTLAASILSHVRSNFLGKVVLLNTMNPFFQIAMEDNLLQSKKAANTSMNVVEENLHKFQQSLNQCEPLG